jgi:GNAT superfamily N-acetyltransferase
VRPGTQLASRNIPTSTARSVRSSSQSISSSAKVCLAASLASLDVGSVAYIPRGYAALVVGDLVVREARPSDAGAIAEVSVASRRWSYRDLIATADLEALSVEDATTDFAEGLAELSSGAAVFVAELTGRVVGYAYVLPSPDADVPAETSELGSLYVTEEVAGTEVAPALMDAAVEHSRAAGHDVLTLWVRRENGRARRFYEKHGMREDGTERRRSHDVLPTEMNEIRYRMSL